MVVYCGGCQLVFAAPERLFWNNDCFRCGDSKLITEIVDWLMVIVDAA